MTEQFGIGSMGFGSLPGVLDTMDMVKRTWASMNLPSNFAPTIDLDELDRRITDLKAVEQWLAMNLGMLQGTIKGLEIQRGTIAALQAFGKAMTSPAEAGNFAANAMAAMQRTAAEAAGVSTGTRAGTSPPADAETSPPASQAPTPPRAQTGEAPAEAGTPSDDDDARARPVESLAEGMSRAAAAAANPAAWWNLLQNQFEQVAQAALAGGALAAGQGAGPSAASGGDAGAPAKPEPAKPRGRKAKAPDPGGAPRARARSGTPAR